MLDLSSPRVKTTLFNWLSTMRDASDFTDDQVMTMADHFLLMLKEVAEDQEYLRRRAGGLDVDPAGIGEDIL